VTPVIVVNTADYHHDTHTRGVHCVNLPLGRFDQFVSSRKL